MNLKIQAYYLKKKQIRIPLKQETPTSSEWLQPDGYSILWHNWIEISFPVHRRSLIRINPDPRP